MALCVERGDRIPSDYLIGSPRRGLRSYAGIAGYESSQTKKNSSHRRAILWRDLLRSLYGVLWGTFRSCPLTLRSCLYLGNFLEVCFRTPGTSQKLLQKSALRCVQLLSVLPERANKPEIRAPNDGIRAIVRQNPPTTIFAFAGKNLAAAFCDIISDRVSATTPAIYQRHHGLVGTMACDHRRLTKDIANIEETMSFIQMTKHEVYKQKQWAHQLEKIEMP